MDDLEKANKAPEEGSLENTSENSGTPAQASDTAAESSKNEQKQQLIAEKKQNLLQRFLSHVNIYLLMFIFVFVISAVVATVTYMSSKNAVKQTAVTSQSLSQDALKQLANTDAKVGDAKSVLTIQSNAVFSGQVVIGGDTTIAGSLKLGKPLEVTGIKVTGSSSLGTAQISKLSVANDASLNGSVSVKGDLTVSGASSFSTITAAQINVSNLTLIGSGTLQLNNHIKAGGPPPGFSRGSILGSGGTASSNGSDTAGSVSVNTGNNPGAGCFATITFAQSFSSTPRVIITPVGPGAATIGYYITRSATGFSICSANTLPAGKSFGFDYIVFQ